MGKFFEAIDILIPVEGNIGDISTNVSIQCLKCKNFKLKLTCEAFPDGIPEKILSGDFDHTKQFKGEKRKNGKPILFEFNPEI